MRRFHDVMWREEKKSGLELVTKKLVSLSPSQLGVRRMLKESIEKRGRSRHPMDKGGPRRIQGLGSIREARRNKDHWLLHTHQFTMQIWRQADPGRIHMLCH